MKITENKYNNELIIKFIIYHEQHFCYSTALKSLQPMTTFPLALYVKAGYRNWPS